MKLLVVKWSAFLAINILFFACRSAYTNPLQIVSAPAAPLTAAPQGNGDSGQGIITPDGRYVLFTSAANNLTLLANSNPIPVLIPPKLNVYQRDRVNGLTTLVSVNLAGNGGNGDSLAMGISTNGQYALIESAASDLVPGDTNSANDIFLRDVVNGTTTLVSVSTNGGVGNGASSTPVMTPDDRYVAFVSSANNLVAGTTNGIPNIFVRDVNLGITTLASPGAISAGISAASESAAPAITPDGRYVLFYSTATNLLARTSTMGDIYVNDRIAGTIYRASSAALSELQSVFGTTSGACFSAKISTNGMFVAYEVSAANFSHHAGIVLRYNLQTGLTDVVNTNANAPIGHYENLRTLDMSDDGRYVASVGNIDSRGMNTAVFVWDSLTGTNLLAGPAWSNSVPANGINYLPLLDPSGRFVAFLSSATNLTTNTIAAQWNLYCHDTQNGNTVLVSSNTNAVGTGVNCESFPSWSADARFLAYESAATGDRNQYFNVLVSDLVSNTTEIASTPNPLFQFPSPDGPSVCFPACISTNGRYVAFASDADNLVANATNGFRNVYVSDLYTGSNTLVSVDTNGLAAAGNSSDPSMSWDGRFVAFSSTASSLVTGDTNNSSDIFIRDLQNGITSLVSVNESGNGPGTTNSYSPTISGDGRFVMFLSPAQNLTTGTFGNGVVNLFLRDLQVGTNYALTSGSSGSGVVSAAMTPDGHYVAFIGSLNGSASNLYVWNSYQRMRIYTNPPTSLAQVAISPDGQRLAYNSSTSLFLTDLVNPANNATVATGPFYWVSGESGLNNSLAFSGDGRFLAYNTAGAVSLVDTNGVSDVYLYDVLAQTNLLVSLNDTGTGAGNDASDSPSISPDGRFVAFRSFASNLVPGDSNGVPDIFLYDRSSGAMTLLTASQFGNHSGANRSARPFFSGNGQTLVFQSAASDIVTNDFNRDGDVFAFNLFMAGMIPFFTVQAVPSGSPNQNPTLVWPVVPGDTYTVLFKNNLTDAAWQILPGNVTILGNTAYFNDTTTPVGQRFYKIIGD